MTETTSPLDVDRRPGVVTFVAIILYINAAIAFFNGIFAFVQRDDSEMQASLGLDSDQIVWFMVVELVIGLVVLIVAGGVMNGARWARMLVTLGMGFRLVQAAFFATTGGEGNAGVLAASIYVVIPLIVLWAVWGHDRGEAWFHHTSK